MKDVTILSSLMELGIKVESFKTELDSINRCINQYRIDIQNLSKRTDLPHELTSVKETLANHLEKFSNSDSSLKNTIQELRILFTSQKISHDLVSKKADQLSEKLFELENEIQTMKAASCRRNDSLLDEINDKFKAVAAYHANDLFQLRSEIIASPKSILESNQSILKKLELASLDGVNAAKKATDIDIKMHALQKRFDSLELLIKKMEKLKQE